ncbi:MAG: BREX-3 system phosphatase PglZ, partial [Bryobacteraceae bacterium]
MPDWRDQIFKEFTPGVQPVTVVADPDRLLIEPRLCQVLSEKGFELLPFEDSISFRFAYESRFRSRMDAGENVDLVVLLADDASSFGKLPFDVLTRARRLSFGLANVFSQFAYPVLRALDPQYLDLLYEAQLRSSPGVLGENATKDFILRHVFAIVPELVKTDSDLLRTLLRRHYRPQLIASEFIARLIQFLSQNDQFAAWPLGDLFSDRSLFFEFLQERWPHFLSQQEAPANSGKPVSFKIAGPDDIPFDDPDVRVYLDNLFVEGILRPIPWNGDVAAWIAAGVERDPEQDRKYRLASLLEIADRELPNEGSQHGEWLSFASTWAEINAVVAGMAEVSKSAFASRFLALQDVVDSRFGAWLQKRFGSLYSLPPNPPVMVHHVARYLAGLRDDKNTQKVALL